MQYPRGFIEGTYTDTVGAVCFVVRPESEAFLGIDMPGVDILPVGNIVGTRIGRPEINGSAGTFFCTFFAYHAEISHSELNGAVRHHR